MTYHRTHLLATIAGAFLVAHTTTVATASTPARDTAACSFVSTQLPRTADAIDGWYAQCRSTVDQAGAARPRTPDAIEAWLSRQG